jgi:hypothetical protein
MISRRCFRNRALARSVFLDDGLAFLKCVLQ